MRTRLALFTLGLVASATAAAQDPYPRVVLTQTPIAVPSPPVTTNPLSPTPFVVRIELPTPVISGPTVPPPYVPTITNPIAVGAPVDTLGQQLRETMPLLGRPSPSAYAGDATLLDLPDTMPGLRRTPGVDLVTSTVEGPYTGEVPITMPLVPTVTQPSPSELRIVVDPLVPVPSCLPTSVCSQPDDGLDRTGADGRWQLPDAQPG